MAVSRTVDKQHSTADVLGGMFLGTLVAIVYILRSIPRYRRVLSPDRLEGCQQGQAATPDKA